MEVKEVLELYDYFRNNDSKDDLYDELCQTNEKLNQLIGCLEEIVYTIEEKRKLPF